MGSAEVGARGPPPTRYTCSSSNRAVWLAGLSSCHRGSRRRRPVALALEAAGEVVDPALGPADILERDETERRVAAAIDALPERQRAAILLTYREELSNAEVAAVIDTSISGVETLLVRARRSLRAKLGADLKKGEG